MLKWRSFPKLSYQIVFWFLTVGALLTIGQSVYHFYLCNAALKQQTLPGLGGPEYLLNSIALLKTRMLLSILVALGLAAVVFYGVAKKIAAPLGEMADAVERAAKTGDLNQSVEVDGRDEIGRMSKAFHETMSRMKEMAEAVSGIAAGNLDRRIELRSEQDTFGKAFQSMTASLKRSQEAFRESEEKLRGLVTHAPIGLSMIHQDGRYEYVNPKFVEIFGYTLEDIPTGHEWSEKAFPDPRYREKALLCWREDLSAARAGKPMPRVLTVTCKDRSEKEILFKRIALIDGRYYLSYEDVTERNQAEEVLKKREKEFQRLAEENALMAEIGRIINSSLNIDEVYDRFAEEVRKHLSFDRISINFVIREDNTARSIYIAGADVTGRSSGDVTPLKGTALLECMRTRSSMLLQPENVEECIARFPALSPTFQAGLRSIMFIPLISKDQGIGALSLRSFKAKAYTDRDVKLAENIGNQIAGAIANASSSA